MKDVDSKLVAPCGIYCEPCKFLNSQEQPSCLGCGKEKGSPFWGQCKVYSCANSRKVVHCGVCQEFPCDVFINQFDPAHGQKSAFTRAGLLAYRNRAGTQKFIEMSEKLEKEDQQKK